MTRLDRERQRLFPGPDHCPAGHVRTLRLGVSGPGAWPALATVWQGVQAELDLPAPAIEIDGQHGFALWFSVADAVPAPQAEAFLQSIQARWLHGLAAGQVRLQSGISPDASQTLPPALRQPEQWSAFVARDLAPVFGDTPWLDTPPNPEGQADLLSGLRCIDARAWQQALQSLQNLQGVAEQVAQNTPTATFTDPRQFLSSVMNDPQAPLALRIEAAKALLP